MNVIADTLIVDLLSNQREKMSGAQIASALGMGSGQLYPALARLEASEQVQSEWTIESRPRRRIYWVEK